MATRPRRVSNPMSAGDGEHDSYDVDAVARTAAGNVSFAPVTITFLAMPDAGNGACR